MKNMTSFRITALSCFYFALISLVSPFRETMAPTAIMAGLILLSTFVAVRFEKPLSRLAFAVIPLLWAALIALVDWPTRLVYALCCAVPALISGLTLALGREEAPLWRYRREFLILSALCGLLLVLSLNPLVFSLATCVFIGAFLLFGVLALRAGRAGQNRSGRWQAGNAGLLLLPILAAAGVGTLLMVGFDALMEYLRGFFVDERIAPARSTPSPMIDGHAKLPPLASMGHSTAVPYDLVTEPPKEVSLINTQGLDWKWILVGVLLIAATVILIRLLLGNQDKAPKDDTGMEPVLEEAQSDRRRGRRKRRRRNEDSNGEKVRELYRRYLDYLRVKGVFVEQSGTTLDVSEGAMPIAGDDTLFREIYRKARYDGNGEITDEELAQARECYQRLVTPEKPEQPE